VEGSEIAGVMMNFHLKTVRPKGTLHQIACHTTWGGGSMRRNLELVDV
jgi:hypothetical protein